jgi:SAM-dependent methyltransferase
LVVDLGCGTGLSTAAWAERAGHVVGVEPSPSMLGVARRRLPAQVELRQGPGHDTGLDTGSVDVVTAVQSFHWMGPGPTLAGIARILRPGGVFAAADSEGPFSVDWEVEAAELRFAQTAGRLREALGIPYIWPQKWPKAGHLEALRRSGHFRYTKEVLLHGTEAGSAERYVQLTINWMVDFLDELHAHGITDEQLELTDFRAAATRVIGTRGQWLTSWRVRLGVRA